jgi:hypothetical protein
MYLSVAAEGAAVLRPYKYKDVRDAMEEQKY